MSARENSVVRFGRIRAGLNAGQSHAIGMLATTTEGGYPATQMVIELPDELKGVGEAVSAMIRHGQVVWQSTHGEKRWTIERLSGNWLRARR